jgi:cytochrome c-type biogenesis protein CcmH
MTSFALIATFMLGAALLFLLPALLKKPAVAPGGALAGGKLALYRHQLAELEADVCNGTLSNAQLEESRRELERRVLDDLADARPASEISSRAGRWMAVVVGLCVPLLATLLYWRLGTPEAIDLDLVGDANPHAMSHAASGEQLEQATERLAARLKDTPQDGEGWALLGRSYAVLGRHAEAVSALRRADSLVPHDAALLADLADALAMVQAGRLTGEPMQIVRRALKADPDNAKALALAGTDAFDRRDYRSAVRYWRRAVAAAPPDSELAASLSASLEEARSLAGMPSAAMTPSASASVSGRVVLASNLVADVSPDDVLLLFARAENGPRMPLALIKARVKDLPLDFVLDDASAMLPALRLSSAERVVVVARISKSGTAEAQSGDLQGATSTVRVGASGLRVEIAEKLR